MSKRILVIGCEPPRPSDIDAFFAAERGLERMQGVQFRAPINPQDYPDPNQGEDMVKPMRLPGDFKLKEPFGKYKRRRGRQH